MREKAIEHRLVKLVTARKGLALKLEALHFTGIPDRLVLLPGGIVFFVETKSSEGGLRPRQKRVHKQLQDLGFEVYVINSTGGVDWLLQKFMK